MVQLRRALDIVVWIALLGFLYSAVRNFGS